MATDEEQPNKRMKFDAVEVEENNDLIYILKNKIQNNLYLLLNEKALSKGLPVTDTLSPVVTHVVTGCKTREEALQRFDLDDEVWCQDVHIVSTNWLSACIKVGRVVEVTMEYRLPHTPVASNEPELQSESFPQYECQRATPLNHHNHQFSDALDTLASKAEMKDDDANYIRALAFRRASCCLKSLPSRLTIPAQLRGMRYMGNHSKQVVLDVLENGFSSEAHDVQNDEWYRTMKIFTEVFGVGKKIGDEWYQCGHRTIDDVLNDANLPRQSDQRIVMGLAYYRDLTLPVLRVEADYIHQLVTRLVDGILPGCRVVLTGGFRRGKDSGHDIDILISHPVEGREHGLLPDLLRKLQRLGLVLYGGRVESNFSEERIQHDRAGRYLRSSLDHFEKWIGILKVDKKVRDGTLSDSATEGGDLNSHVSGDTAEGGARNGMVDNVEIDLTVDEEGTSENQASQSNHARVKSMCEEAKKERTWHARRVDLIIAPASQYYYALVGWTGSKQFNRSLRHYADKEMKMKLTSHGLYDHTQRRTLPAASEEEVFNNLKVPHRDPTLRNC